MSRIKLPTKEECIKILEENNVPKNIIEHCKAVNKVAVFLAKMLKEKGVSVSIELVDRASLLHDLDRVKSKDHSHGYITEEILTKKGYAELGRAIVGHRFTKVLDKNLTWEEKIINYADKRVREASIVSLSERFDDLIKRHNVKPEERNHEAEKAFFELEKEIFKRIGILPNELKGQMEVEQDD